MNEPTPQFLEKAKFEEWKPGQSGNPKGKPKGTIDMAKRIKKILAKDIEWDKISITDASLDRLKKRYGNMAVADAMIWVQVSKALTGDTQAFNALKEAGWGKTVNVDAHAEIDVVHIMKPEKLEAAQLENAAEQLRQRAMQTVEGEVIDNELGSPAGTAELRAINT